MLRLSPADNAPARSRTHHSYYRHPDLTDAITERRFPGFNKIIVDEDFWAAARIQQNLDDWAQPYGLYNRIEPAFAHHRRVQRDTLGLPG